jgi:flavin reductase (DIM6/NTAB) family NADH-FMN oxidoreductase RutF
MVSCAEEGKADNIITVAWTGTICTNPPMAYISVRPERHSYDMIKNSGEFVINLTTKDLVKATDYCGVRSGRDVDKFQEMKLTKGKATHVKAPLIQESPVNIECKVREIKELGSHHMFLADVVGVNIDTKYMNENGTFQLNRSDLIVYSHGEYYGLGELLGTFGYSVQKKKVNKKKKRNHRPKKA